MTQPTPTDDGGPAFPAITYNGDGTPKAWTKGMRSQFQGRPLGGVHQQALPVLQPGAFKIL